MKKMGVWTETESSNSEPETGQRMYKSPMSEICDAVFEVQSAAGVNVTIPCLSDEIKACDEEGVFQTLLTY